jgi:hypothetical protein
VSASGVRHPRNAWDRGTARNLEVGTPTGLGGQSEHQFLDREMPSVRGFLEPAPGKIDPQPLIECESHPLPCIHAEPTALTELECADRGGREADTLAQLTLDEAPAQSARANQSAEAGELLSVVTLGLDREARTLAFHHPGCMVIQSAYLAITLTRTSPARLWSPMIIPFHARDGTFRSGVVIGIRVPSG